jgi:hypothetical protein
MCQIITQIYKRCQVPHEHATTTLSTCSKPRQANTSCPDVSRKPLPMSTTQWCLECEVAFILEGVTAILEKGKARPGRPTRLANGMTVYPGWRTEFEPGATPVKFDCTE